MAVKGDPKSVDLMNPQPKIPQNLVWFRAKSSLPENVHASIFLALCQKVIIRYLHKSLVLTL
ncbi:MAG: hypothetical protein CM15mP29_0870 [Alphaproteobacteria bacterium]|nr:MAG: hypothetical protein CM15mP29_0870 [Alphaproteobacteria bacterium]